MAYKVFANGFPLQASELNSNLMQQSIAVFVDSTSRDAAIASPVEGQFAYLTASDTLVKYDGAAWVPAIADAGDITAVTAGTGLTGGGTTGDVTLDVDLSIVQALTPAVNAKTAAYTLVVGDRGKFVTASGTFTITIPSATFSAGDRVDFVNTGTGIITFAGSGVTVNSVDAALTIDTRWAGATFFFTSSSAGVLIGKLA